MTEYALITFVSRFVICASGINVNFLDVLDHMTAYILPRFTSKRLPHMISITVMKACIKVTYEDVSEKGAVSLCSKLTFIFEILTLSITFN